MKKIFLLKFFKDISIPLHIKISSTLLILLPYSLITGPAVPDMILSLLALYFLIISIIKKKWQYYNNFFFYYFLIFCLCGITYSLFTNNFVYSVKNEGSIFYFRYIFFSLSVWFLINENKYLAKSILFSNIFLLLIVIFDGFFQYFVGNNILGNPTYSYSDYRLTGFFGDEPIIGRFVSLLTIFTFSLIYFTYEINKKILIISLSLLILSEVFVFISGERAPLFYLVLFSASIIFFFPSFRLIRILGFLISLSIIFFILSLNPSAKHRMINVTINEVSETKLPYLPYSELHERHFITALNMFKHKPIFGVGQNLYRNLCDDDKYFYKVESCSTHPHNYYIQLLAENGLVGFLFLFCLFLFISFFLIIEFFKQLFFNQRKYSIQKIIFFILSFVYLWPLIPTMSLYNNWNNVLLFLPVGFLLKILYEKKNVSEFS